MTDLRSFTYTYSGTAESKSNPAADVDGCGDAAALTVRCDQRIHRGPAGPAAAIGAQIVGTAIHHHPVPAPAGELLLNVKANGRGDGRAVVELRAGHGTAANLGACRS